MNLDGVRGVDGLGHILNQQVGQNAGVNVPRPQHNGVGAGNGLQNGGIGVGFGVQVNIVDGDIKIVAAQVNGRFAHQPGAVLQPGAEGGLGEGNGQHGAGVIYAQNPGGLGDGGNGVAGDFGKRRQQQVAEAVVFEAVAGGEAVVKKAAHQVGGFVIAGQRHQAAAQVAGRQMPQLLAQTPAAAAAVGHRHHGGEVAVAGAQAGKRGMVAGAAADDDNVLSGHQLSGRWSGHGGNLRFTIHHRPGPVSFIHSGLVSAIPGLFPPFRRRPESGMRPLRKWARSRRI